MNSLYKKLEQRHMRNSLLLILLLVVLCISCDDEATSSLTLNEDTSKMIEVVKNEGVLLDLKQDSKTYNFFFDTDTIVLPASEIVSLEQNFDNWKTTIVLKDNNALTIPTIGKSLNINSEAIKMNPSGYAPLSAQITLSFPIKGRLKVSVKGKKGAFSNMTNVFQKYGYNHQEYIHGFYENYANTLYVVLTDKNGKELLKDSLIINVPDYNLSSFLPKMQTIISKPERMEPGVTLVNYLGDNEYDTHRPFMLDCIGDVRWVLILKDHPDMKITAHTGLKRMKNGHFYCGDVKTSRLLEFDMIGNLINSWDLKAKGYLFHHDVIELPNGHFLTTVSKQGSTGIDGNPTIYDYVVELDNQSNSIVTEWDLKKSLDETRKTLIPPGDTIATRGNWAHANAVSYSENDDCIIVSCRFQGIAKINRQNQLQWLISPHKDWKKATGLLTPLQTDGQSPQSNDVIDGIKRADDFDWTWGQHDPVLLPNGHLLVFDNGFYRQYENIDLYSSKGYSRVVEYKIDESKRTIQQVWQYGQERGRSCFSIAVSSVQFLPTTNHALFCPGLGTPNENGVGGKIIEVDYSSREVVYEAHLSTPNFMAFHRSSRIPLYPTGI